MASLQQREIEPGADKNVHQRRLWRLILQAGPGRYRLAAVVSDLSETLPDVAISVNELATGGRISPTDCFWEPHARLVRLRKVPVEFSSTRHPTDGNSPRNSAFKISGGVAMSQLSTMRPTKRYSTA